MRELHSITPGMELNQLSKELAESFANNRIALPEDPTLAQLIYSGKIQFLKQSILSDYSEDKILGYTPTSCLGNDE